jgi:hypothetical protein
VIRKYLGALVYACENGRQPVLWSRSAWFWVILGLFSLLVILDGFREKLGIERWDYFFMLNSFVSVGAGYAFIRGGLVEWPRRGDAAGMGRYWLGVLVGYSFSLACAVLVWLVARLPSHGDTFAVVACFAVLGVVIPWMAMLSVRSSRSD